MGKLLFILGSLAVLLIGLNIFRHRARLRQITLDRLEEEPLRAPLPPGRLTGPLPSLSRHPLLPWLGGALLGLALNFLISLPLVFCLAFGFTVGIILTLLDSGRVAKLVQKLEFQLAEAIDMMIGALRAGMGSVDSLEHATRETPKPIRPVFEEFLGRLRLGEDPQEAVKGLQRRVPLEPFRLFAAALAVHWETGGNLAPNLAGVGRTVRDRVELSRRVRGQSTQARASVLAILLLSYFLGLIVWRSNTERMEGFLVSEAGQGLVAGAMFLQSIGLIWIGRMSRISF